MADPRISLRILTAAVCLLVAAPLLVEIHNDDIASSDLSLIPSLSVEK
jgi:hypothetical protein